MVNARNTLVIGLPSPAGSAPVEWRVSDRSGLPTKKRSQRWRRGPAEIAAGRAAELVWLLEHPPLYTAGTSANPADVIDARFPIHESGRGGQLTYHGPGQRVAYVMLDLKRRGPDVRRFVATLEEWIIRTLAALNVRARTARRPNWRLGTATRKGRRLRGQDRRHRHPREAVGDAARHRAECQTGLIAFLRHRAMRRERKRYAVTSLADLGISVSLAEVDTILRREFDTAVWIYTRSNRG